MPHPRFTPLQHERFRLVELVDDILAIIIRQLVDSQPRAALRLLQVCTVLCVAGRALHVQLSTVGGLCGRYR